MRELLLLIIEIAYIITVVGVVVVIISENRNPVKTISWVLILIFVPVVGLIWYAVFGQDITKEQVISKRMYSKLKRRPLDEAGTPEEVPYPEEHERLVHLLRSMDNTPLLGGNSMILFTNGADKFRHLLLDIAQAKEHIHIDYYVFHDDKLGNSIKNALIEKSLQGVEVRVIYDSFGSRQTGKAFFEDMRKAGIEAESFLKIAMPKITSRLNYRNHRKIVVIDGRIGYVGGMNIADRYVDGFEWGIWRDTHARVEGKGVQGLQSIFFIDWFFVSQTLITSRKYFPVLPNFGNVAMQTVNSGPLKDERQIAYGITQAIYEAKKSILIQTPYFIPPESVIGALQTAALRGVDVRVMMSKRSDVTMVQKASKSYVKQMLESGIKMFFYTKGFLHSKMMVFDESLTLIGSVNFDNRSFEYNFEIESFVYSEEVAANAIQIFGDDVKNSEEVLLKEWMKRPKINRFIESIFRLFAPLF